MTYNPQSLPHMKDQEFTRQYVQKLNPPVFENVSRRNWQKDLHKTHNYTRSESEPRTIVGQVIIAVAIFAILAVCWRYSAEITAVFEIGKEVKGGR